MRVLLHPWRESPQAASTFSCDVSLNLADSVGPTNVKMPGNEIIFTRDADNTKLTTSLQLIVVVMAAVGDSDGLGARPFDGKEDVGQGYT
jgi:hypothetical protein